MAAIVGAFELRLANADEEIQQAYGFISQPASEIWLRAIKRQ